MILTLTNTVTKQGLDIEVTDIQDSRLFYHFNLELPQKMDEGSYTYTLRDDDTILATGLCQIGDYKAENTTYKTNGNTIKYYGKQ